MRINKFLCLFIVIFSISSFAYTPYTLKTTSTGYDFEFSLPEAEISTVDTSGHQPRAAYTGIFFSSVTVPEFNLSGKTGQPQLPSYNISVAVASLDALPAIAIDNVTSEVITVKEHIFPVQKRWPKSRLLSERPFTIDNNYYSTSQSESPVLATITESSTLAAVPYIKIQLNPFSYNPVKKELTIYTKFTLRVETNVTAKIPGPSSKDFESILRSEMANYDHIITSNALAKKAKENYLIIAGTTYFSSASLAQFVEFRKQRFNVTLISVSTAGGVDHDKIVAYIKTLSPRPNYILLVGDTKDIPSKALAGASDLRYGDVEGDYKQEIMVGRFSVSSETELKNIITKTMFMENEMINMTTKNNLYIGCYEVDYGTIPEKTHNYIITNYFTPKGYTNTKLYYNSNTSINKSNLTTALNNSPIFCFYSGHGTPTSWAVGNSWGYSTIDYKALTNNKAYPFTFNFCCETGIYDQTVCYSEAQIRATKGSVAVLSASIPTDWDPDDQFEKGIAAAMFSTSSPKTTLGAAVIAGKLKVTGTTKDYWEAYNILGDPALSLIALPQQGSTPVALRTIQTNPLSFKYANNSISFLLNESSPIKVALYNAQGKFVQTLLSGNYLPGSYSFSLNSTIFRNLAKGVYFCKLETPSVQKVQSIVLR
jgi:hypothetical protein